MASPVDQLVAQKNIEGLLEYCEMAELEIASAALNEMPSYTIMILGYLIVDDLPSAKFVWKRIPDQFKQGKDVHAAWAIGKAMWNQNHKGVFEAIRAFRWNPLLQQLVSLLEESYRNRMIVLVSRAYTTVRVADLAILLGANEVETRKFAESRQWSVRGDIVSPIAPPAASAAMPEPNKSLVSLTNYASYMETAQ
jgi:hypothetical protein